jgi:glycosyltransferase involved in cell wall biosynthesis
MLVIYDLQYINQPHNYSRFYLFFLKAIIDGSVKTADGIITISNQAKNDIVKYYKLKPENVTVGYLGVDHTVFFPGSSQDIAAARTKYNLPEHYLLYAASLLPHKNHERLLKAFQEIKGTMPGRKLVLTGAWETGYDRTFAIISALGLQKDVVMLGWVPFEDIPLIYRGAELFVYPSLHEGFGLPLLEAMASGIPVVCSRVEPLTEVAGDAAVLVDPYDHSDIARGILSIWRDKTLRMKLIEAGLERARTFTWDRTATKTLDFLNSHKPYRNI